MLFLFEDVQSLVDFEHFTVPLLLVQWLVEQSVDYEFREDFKRGVEYFVVHLLDLPERKTIVQSSHFCLIRIGGVNNQFFKFIL